MSLRQVGSAVGLAVPAGSAVFALNLFGLRTRILGEELPEARAPATGRQVGESSPASDEGEEAEATIVRSHPWWQHVATLEDDGDASVDITLDDGALQWRVQWECQLAVDAAGLWSVTVAQQIDVPSRRPPPRTWTTHRRPVME